jgi:hypothetical protein
MLRTSYEICYSSFSRVCAGMLPLVTAAARNRREAALAQAPHMQAPHMNAARPRVVSCAGYPR